MSARTIRFHWKSHILWSLYVSTVAAFVAGGSFAALQYGSENGADPLTVNVGAETYMVSAYVPERAAATSPLPERNHPVIRNIARPIEPCRHEDGSGQRAMCVWNDGTGDVIVNITTKSGDDRTVVLFDRTPSR